MKAIARKISGAAISRLRIVLALAALPVLGTLLVRAVNSWRAFSWPVFFHYARYINIWCCLGAVGLIYAEYFVRAVRWRVLLHPMKDVPAARLYAPTVIGFAGLAILGRPGELVRPCLIARKEGLSIASQMAVLTLERILDAAGAGVLVLAALLASSRLRFAPYLAQLSHAGLLLGGSMAVLTLVVLLLVGRGKHLGMALHDAVASLSSRLADKLTRATEAFCSQLSVIRNPRSLATVFMLSLAIWLLISLAYLQVLHAFSTLRTMSLAQALLLLGFALLGSLVQLPAGGTQQLVIFAILVDVFGVPVEVAVSCSLLAWLTIFMAPVPVGLAMLHREQMPLRSLLHGRAEPEEALIRLSAPALRQ